MIQTSQHTKEWEASLFLLNSFLKRKEQEHSHESELSSPIFRSLQKELHELEPLGDGIFKSKNQEKEQYVAAAFQLLAVCAELQKRAVKNLTSKTLEKADMAYGIKISHFKPFRRPRTQANIEITLSDIALSLMHELFLESKMSDEDILACSVGMARVTRNIFAVTEKKSAEERIQEEARIFFSTK